MGGVTDVIVDPIGSMNRAIGKELFGGSPSAPAPTAQDPRKSYLARERTSGRTEGKARDALEEEKRRRYQAYANTLLGSAGSQPVGDPAPSEPDIAGGGGGGGY